MTLFYFHKGDKVPQWLFSIRCAGTGVPVDVATFCTNGKVYVMPNGDAYIWPSSTRFKCIIHLQGNGLSLTVDANGAVNHMFNFQCGVRTLSGTYRKLSPLAHIRSSGTKIHTSTKCDHITELYHPR